MPKKNLHHCIVHLRLFSRLLPIFLLLTPWRALAGGAGPCSCADLLALDTTFRGAGGDRSCHRIDVPGPGVLAVDASAPGSPEAEPHLVFLGSEGPAAAGYRILRQTPRGVLVKLGAAGTFFVVVGPEDPARPLPGYKLSTVFASVVPTKDVEEDDEDGSDIKGMLKRATAPRAALCAVLEQKLETYGYAELDDHGDTPLCATPLALGGSVSGEIENALGDDEDFFTFALGKLRGVSIGATAGHLTLYDARGQRLASSGEDEAPGLVRVLSPGRYYLRLQSIRGPGGSYVLSLGTADEPYGAKSKHELFFVDIPF